MQTGLFDYVMCASCGLVLETSEGRCPICGSGRDAQ